MPGEVGVIFWGDPQVYAVVEVIGVSGHAAKVELRTFFIRYNRRSAYYEIT